MKFRKLTHYFYLLLIILFISSCQFWTWYKLKKQLNDVPRYFSIERIHKGDKREDYILMKKPVLKSKNVFFLTKKKPTFTKKNGDSTVEVFQCIRESNSQYSFYVNAHYDKEGYLYRLDPPNILTNVYNDYTYARIGNEILNGDIDVIDYEVKAVYKKDNSNFNILDRFVIEKALGEPDVNSTELKYIYSYKVNTETKASKGVYLDVGLTFTFTATGKIKDIHFNFATVNLYFHYSE